MKNKGTNRASVTKKILSRNRERINRKRAIRLKEGGGFFETTKDLANRSVLGSKTLRAGAGLSYGIGTWMALGAPGLTKDPNVKNQAISLAFWPFAAGASLEKLAQGAKLRESAKKGTVNLRDFTLNGDVVKKQEFNLISSFSKNPKAILREFDHNPIKVAQFYSFVHSMRRVPPTTMATRENYKIGEHENEKFLNAVAQAMFYRLGQLPKKEGNHEELVRKNFKEHKINVDEKTLTKLKGMKNALRYPSDLYPYIPTPVEHAIPETVDEALSLALFETAIARAKTSEGSPKFRKPNRF